MDQVITTRCSLPKDVTMTTVDGERGELEFSRTLKYGNLAFLADLPPPFHRESRLHLGQGARYLRKSAL